MNATDLPGRVREERRRRKWTQRQMAEKAGVALRTYQNFEARTGSPQGANLRAILAAVEMDDSQEALAEATRDEWRPSTKVFLDMMGAYLETMPEKDALEITHQITRQIFEARLP